MAGACRLDDTSAPAVKPTPVEKLRQPRPLGRADFTVAEGPPPAAYRGVRGASWRATKRVSSGSLGQPSAFRSTHRPHRARSRVGRASARSAAGRACEQLGDPAPQHDRLFLTDEEGATRVRRAGRKRRHREHVRMRGVLDSAHRHVLLPSPAHERRRARSIRRDQVRIALRRSSGRSARSSARGGRSRRARGARRSLILG